MFAGKSIAVEKNLLVFLPTKHPTALVTLNGKPAEYLSFHLLYQEQSSWERVMEQKELSLPEMYLE